MDKKGYFFTIDGLIAVGILIVGFVFILSVFISVPPELQAEFFSSDVLDLFDNIRIGELDSDIYGDILILPGVSNENTLLEQMAYYCNKGGVNLGYASSIAEDITSGGTEGGNLIRTQYGWELILKDNNGVEKCNVYSTSNRLSDNPTIVITAKDIVYFRDGTILRGPWIAEVNVWQ